MSVDVSLGGRVPLIIITTSELVVAVGLSGRVQLQTHCLLSAAGGSRNTNTETWAQKHEYRTSYTLDSYIYSFTEPSEYPDDKDAKV